MQPSRRVHPAENVSLPTTVAASNLEMHYRVGPETVRAVDGVSLEIPEGQFVVVRGRSGSGKTTLLHLLAGLEQPTAGEVHVGGVALHALRPREADLFRRRHVGLIFQFFNLIPSLTVEMNVALPLLLDGRRLHELGDRIGELLDVLGVSHRRRHSPHQLSGGEMQRVAIARALIVSPRILLADEPTGNLDSKNAHDVFHLLRAQGRERNVTMVVLTHDPDASAYADRVIEMQDGRVIKDTTRGIGAGEQRHVS
ncbi:sulfate transport system ATP-binding protein [Myxococcaceae bacterium]|jgi:putative ABC transport system ATP-binding protein|nr:sulfate transport system ATP-binding protein [Myxococcaceae bacterium]